MTLTPIIGATLSNYTVGSGDVGHTLYCRVTATNTAGFGSASSAATATVTGSTGTNTLARVIACMDGGAHESPPEGVPAYWTWGSGPELDSPTPPSNRTAITYWGQVYQDSAYSFIPTNSRINFRYAEAWLLLASTGRWTAFQQDVQPGGSRFQEPFSNSDSWAPFARTESDGSLSLKMQDGYLFHIYGATWPRPGINPSDILGAFTTVQARIILDNGGGTDDRSNAHLVLNMGMDWWNTTTGTDITQVAQMCESRFMRVPNDGTWTAVSAWSGPADLPNLGANDGSGRYQTSWSLGQYLWNVNGALTYAQINANPPPLNAMGG